MLVSVVIPAFNAVETLERAVRSLSLALSDGVQLEVLVVDDGSTDSTWSLANTLAGRFPTMEVKCLQHSGAARRGVSASRNLGINAAAGEAIAFLDADDTVLANRFADSVRMLNEYPDVDAVYESAIVRVESESQGENWIDGQSFGITTPLSGDDLLRKLIEGYPWPTCSILCRPGLLGRTGGFPEDFSVSEDCHLWLRMATIGKIVPGELSFAVAEYRRRDGSLFVPGHERYLDYFRMLCSYSKWVKSRQLDARLVQLVSSAIQSRIDSYFIQFRENGRFDLARRLAWRVLRDAPQMLNVRMLSHLVRGAFEAERNNPEIKKPLPPSGAQS